MDYSVYASNCDDFTTNGLTTLIPTSATVTETAGGSYECEMQIPMSPDDKWKYATVGAIVRLPTPTLTTPRLSLVHDELSGEGLAVYKANRGWMIYTDPTDPTKTVSKRVKIGVKDAPSKSARNIDLLAENEECVLLSRTYQNDFMRVSTNRGNTGWVHKDLVTFVKDLQQATNKDAWREVVPARKSRSQLFRIYSTEESEDGTTLTVRGRHIFYDLLFDMAPEYKTEVKILPMAALDQISAQLLNKDHGFSFYCNSKKKSAYDYKDKNMVEMLLENKTGILRITGTELYRDNFDVFLLANAGQDRGVTIRYGKNLIGVSISIDESNVVTRLCPYGQDGKNKRVYLSPRYVDSKNIKKYPFPRIKIWSVSGATIGGTDKDDPNGKKKLTRDGVIKMLKAAAQEQLDNGCDTPKVEMKVSFQDLGGTEEYRQYAELQYIYLYDRVTIIHEPRGIKTTATVTGYTWNCKGGYYQEITLDNKADASAGISVSGASIAAGTISSGKLSSGAVGVENLQDLSIRSAAIQNAAITGAKIDNATINALTANALIAVQARIDQLTAGTITTDQMKTNMVEALTARIGQLDAEGIDAASIAAEVVNAVEADIGTLTADELAARVIEATEARLESVEADDLKADTLTAIRGDVYTLKATNLSAEQLNAEVARIVKAEVDQIVIHAAQIDDLEATAAAIVTAQISQAVIDQAQIKDLSTTLASIRNADIDFAKVKNLDADEALIRQGNAGEYHIDKLAVNAAQMVDLTVGQLCVKANDGKYYSLAVDIESGNVTATETTVTEDELTAGQTGSGRHIIETDLTVDSLSTTSAKATEALINRLAAGRIDVGELFAKQATIDQLAVVDLSGNGSVTQTVTDAIDGLSEEGGAIRNLGDQVSSLQQTASGLSVDFGTLKDRTDAAAKLLDHYGAYLRFTADDFLEIGKQGDNYSVRITNDRMSFMQSETEVAYISNNELIITEATASRKLQIGKLVAQADDDGISWIIDEEA